MKRKHFGTRCFAFKKGILEHRQAAVTTDAFGERNKTHRAGHVVSYTTIHESSEIYSEDANTQKILACVEKLRRSLHQHFSS
jgi:hypothetical protein